MRHLSIASPGLVPLGRSLPAFLVAGAVGFAVDAGILMVATTLAGWPPLAGRAVSFPVALTCTWWLNRRFAFAGRGLESAAGEYAVYSLIQILGAIVNMGVFVACLELRPAWGRVPVVPLAIGAAVAMVFNFSALRSVLYRRRRRGG